MTILDNNELSVDSEDSLRSKLDLLESNYRTSQEALHLAQSKLTAALAQSQSQAHLVRASEQRLASLGAMQKDADGLLRANADLAAKLAKAEQRVASLGAMQKNADGLLKHNAALAAKLAEAERLAQETLAQQANIRRELAGFRGKLERVAFVLDCSGSMKNQWLAVTENITLWVQHLDVQECVFFFFASDVERYPKQGGFYRVAAETKLALVDELKSLVAAHQPNGGFTNTHSALQAAFSVPKVDTIILFTDGAPTTNASRFIEKEMTKVLDLCSENSHIPVNVIGSGIYNDKKDLVDFLVKIAQCTNGTFLGH